MLLSDSIQMKTAKCGKSGRAPRLRYQQSAPVQAMLSKSLRVCVYRELGAGVQPNVCTSAEWAARSTQGFALRAKCDRVGATPHFPLHRDPSRIR